MKYSRILWSFFALLAAVSYPAKNCLARDPTKPAEKINEIYQESHGLTVSAILIGKNRKIAIVNGKTVKVGNIINGAKVVAINPNFVHFRAEDGDFSVFLHHGDIKKLAKNKR